MYMSLRKRENNKIFPPKAPPVPVQTPEYDVICGVQIGNFNYQRSNVTDPA
jgi:hypothetical protein